MRIFHPKSLEINRLKEVGGIMGINQNKKSMPSCATASEI
jgi:hypothetical protein